MKLKVVEQFYALQGEGRYLGVPSIFLRLFGCNFTCAGFGMPPGQISDEADIIAAYFKKDPTRYRFTHQLPLVKTGCDSYPAWHPGFKDLSSMYDTDVIASGMLALLPYKEWRDEHLVITGGEPLLKGWQKVIPELLSQPGMEKLKALTFETNGTQPLMTDFCECLYNWGKTHQLTFSVSPKLSCSGEDPTWAILPSVVAQYQNLASTYLKFVVTKEQPIQEIKAVVEKYKEGGFNGEVYLMPEGGTMDNYSTNNKTVAQMALKLGYRYTPRLQVDLFRNAWGT